MAACKQVSAPDFPWAIDLRRIDTAEGFLRAALGVFNSKR
jgi:hypothetical protein